MHRIPYTPGQTIFKVFENSVLRISGLKNKTVREGSKKQHKEKIRILYVIKTNWM